MPVLTGLTSGTGSGTGITTASVSPTADRLLMLAVLSARGDSVNASAPSSVTGNGLTWVQIASVVFDTAGVARYTLTLFRAMGAAPSSGVVTINFAASHFASWSLAQSDSDVDTSGTNGSGAIVQSVTGSSASDADGDLTVTLAAFGSSSNSTYGCFGMNIDAGFTVGAGFTLLHSVNDASAVSSLLTETKTANDTTVDATSTASTPDLGGIAVEIAAAGVPKAGSESYSLSTETGSVEAVTEVAGNDSGALSAESGTVEITVTASDSAAVSEGVAWKERQGAQLAAEPARVFVEMEFTQDPPKYAWREVVRADAPTRFFPMNETSGGTATDDAGTPSNGTYVGTRTADLASPIGGDPLERAVSFDASSYLEATAAAAPSKLTVVGWIYNTARPAADADIFVNTGAGKVFLDSAGVIKANFGQALVGPTVPLNTWTHFAVKIDTSVTPNRHRLVVNGELKHELTGAATLGSMTGTYRFGAPGSTQFQGRVKGLAIWDAFVLPVQRVQQQVVGAPVTPKPETSATGTAEAWQDVTRLVREFTIHRGRRDVLDRAEAGTLEMVVDNTDRRFEPDFAGVLVNRVRNPSFGAVLDTYWTPTGATHGFIPYSPGVGSHVLSVTTAGSVAGEGTYYDEDGARMPVLGDTDYSFSFLERQSGGSGVDWVFRVEEYDVGGALIRTTNQTFTPTVGVDLTRRTYSLRTLVATATVRLGWLTSVTSATAVFLDAVQANEGPFVRYVDGDQDDCRWEGTRHLSRSLFGGPYFPNMLPMRRVRISAQYGSNLVIDPSFEDNALATTATDPTKPWFTATVANVTVTRQAGGAHGGQEIKVVRTSGTNEGAVRGTSGVGKAGAGMFRVTPGSFYRVSMALKKEAGGVDPRSRIEVKFYDAKLNQVDFIALMGVDPGTTYARHASSGGERVPDEALWARLDVVPVYSDNSGAATVYCDAVMYEESGSELTSETSFGVGVTNTLFTGHVERWPQDSPSYRRGLVSITAVDGFEPLRQAEIRGDLEQAVSGTRIGRLLDYIGYPDGAGQRDLDAGQTTVCKIDVAESSAKSDVLTQILDVAQTELGLFFLAGDGDPVFHDSLHRTSDPRSTAVQVTLGDGGPPAGELPFHSLTPDFDVARVANEIRATRTAVEGEAEAPVEQVAADGLSQARYYRRTKSYTTLHTTDAAAKTFCAAVLAKLKDAKLEFRQVAFDPAVDQDGGLWRAAIRGELSDRVEIRRRPQQVGDVLERECFIEAITHRCTLGSTIVWLTTWDLSPAT